MPPTIERHLPWPRDRFWRPGEPMTLEENGECVTYRVRGVMRDMNPASEFATVTLEPIRSVPLEDGGEPDLEQGLSNAG